MTAAIRSGPSRPRRRLRHLLAMILGFVLVCMPLGISAYAERTVSTGLAFTIADPRITQSSGLARDTDNNVFWTVNGGDVSGVAYAIGPDGRTRGTVEFSADPIDIEAVAYANRRLYIADIGDNDGVRNSIRIFVIADPAPNQQRGNNFTTYEFTYPDGPHDAEAILVDDSGQIRIVTRAEEAGIYRAPRQPRAAAVNELTRVADAPAYVTDATVLPSGRFAVRTYQSVEILEPELYAPVARAELPYQPKGESLAVSMADNALLIGSEGEQSRVLRVPLPTGLPPVPAGAATPPPSPSPTPEPAPEDTASGVNRSGTFVALGLALLVAIGAGAVVYLRDRQPAEEPPPAPARRGLDAEPAGARAESAAATAAAEPRSASAEQAAGSDGDDGSARSESEPGLVPTPQSPDGPEQIPFPLSEISPDEFSPDENSRGEISPDEISQREIQGGTPPRDPQAPRREPWPWERGMARDRPRSRESKAPSHDDPTQIRPPVQRKDR